ncbi:MAG: asparagine synthase (glutamine-hydrolyzing) [Ectothiorhodospiraceae bacterium]|nr:asparagine synthase (glutamine-hydrolyzing) [Ectothiorhodospiraceae bacterium]
MCGFAGILAYREDSTINESVLQSMSEAIVHRGPDDGGVWISDNQQAGFSFRRLSIIDLSEAGHQPMSSPSGAVTIVFNGEIYNHLTLRKELEAAGYKYRSRTDTETIIYAYQHWGERFVERLEGMFAIALWDENLQKLFLYRDRIGIKPLYYYGSDSRMVFGSEIKAILKHPAISPSVNEQALYHYFTFIHTPAPETLYAGIRKLEPGHYLRLGADGSAEDIEYWDISTAPVPEFDYRDEQAVADEILRLLREAIDKRMMSDVPFGVFLSGGIDSSANVALMAELMDRPVDTFTVAIEGQEATNEFQWARRISKRYGTNHREVIIDDAGFLDLMPHVVFHQDEPLADPVCFPLYHVSKLARDNGTIVIQVGEGSDEQFAGYESYLRMHALQTRYKWIQNIPGFLRSLAYGMATPLLKSRKVDYRQNVIRNAFEGEPVFWGNAIAFFEKEKQRALSPSMLSASAGMNSYDLVRASARKLLSHRDTADEMQQMIYWEMTNRLAELLLMRVDKITMSTSLEARVPFLDHKLVEFSFHIPTAMKIQGGETKAILKRALKSVLPEEIIYRKKIGFAGSGKNMLTPGIFEHAKATVLNPNHDYYNIPYLTALFAEYEQKRINYTPQIWMLYNFEMWHRHWIEGSDISQTIRC